MATRMLIDRHSQRTAARAVITDASAPPRCEQKRRHSTRLPRRIGEPWPRSIGTSSSASSGRSRTAPTSRMTSWPSRWPHQGGGRSASRRSTRAIPPRPTSSSERSSTLGLRGLKLSPGLIRDSDPRIPEAWRLYELAGSSWHVPVVSHSGGAYPASVVAGDRQPGAARSGRAPFPTCSSSLRTWGQPWMGETVMLMRKNSERLRRSVGSTPPTSGSSTTGLCWPSSTRSSGSALRNRLPGRDAVRRRMEQFGGLNRLVEGTNLPRHSGARHRRRCVVRAAVRAARAVGVLKAGS